MDDYRLLIRVKNNLLFKLMRNRGIETQAELARVTGLRQTSIGAIANLKVGAFNADGRPSKATECLCEYFGCLPEDIYPKEVLHVGIPNNVVERIVSSEEVSKYIQQSEADPLFQLENIPDTKFLEQEIKRLPTKLLEVIQLRFFHGKTLQEIADDMGVTKEVIRQRELKALERLRETLRYEDKSEEFDISTGGLATRLADAIVTRDNLKRHGDI